MKNTCDKNCKINLPGKKRENNFKLKSEMLVDVANIFI